VKITKEVKFYDVKIVKTVDQKQVTKKVAADFWAKTLARVEAIADPKDRIHTLNLTRYYGAVWRPTVPPVNHLQVGRIRDLSDHLETTDVATGSVAPLTFGDPNLRVSEPTFVVPFGSKGRVAIFSPGKATRHETIAKWLTLVLNLAPKGKSIRFVPVVNEDALATIVNSKGAVGVEFSVAAGTAMDPEGDGDIPLLDAVEGVLQQGPDAGTLKVSWSLGYDGSVTDRNLIRRVALRIATAGFSNQASVNLLVEDDEGGIRRETHKVFEDHIVEKVSYYVEADEVSNSSVVLRAVGEAVAEFLKRIKD
jgi:hypothetical protein